MVLAMMLGSLLVALLRVLLTLLSILLALPGFEALLLRALLGVNALLILRANRA